MMENNKVKYGVIAGLGTVAFSLLLYLIKPKMMFGSAANGGWLILLFCMYYAVKLDREEMGGFITFKEAFSTAFVVSAISTLLGVVYFYSLFTFIDPSLLEVQRDIAVEYYDWALSFAGNIPEEEYEKGLEAINESVKPPTIGSMAMQLGFGLVVAAIPAGIMALIMKKNKPLGYEEEILDEDTIA